MRTPRLIFLWSFLSFCSATQAGEASIISALYETLLLEENTQALHGLLTACPEHIDPFINGTAEELVYLACRYDDMALLNYLLKHSQYQTISSSALKRVKKTKSSKALLELLKDGRMDVRGLRSLTWHRDLSLKWALCGLSEDLLRACWTGDHKIVKKMVPRGLELEKFDVLLERSRNHLKVLKALRSHFLKSLNLPPKDQDLLRFLASNKMGMEEMVPYVKMKFVLQPVLGRYLLPDILDTITLLAIDSSPRQGITLLPSFCLGAWLFVLYQAVSTISHVSSPLSILSLLAGLIALVHYFFLSHHPQLLKMGTPVLARWFDASSIMFFAYKTVSVMAGSMVGGLQRTLDIQSVALQYIIIVIVALSFLGSK